MLSYFFVLSSHWISFLNKSNFCPEIANAVNIFSSSQSTSLWTNEVHTKLLFRPKNNSIFWKVNIVCYCGVLLCTMWHKCRIFTHKILLGKVFDQAPFCIVGYYRVFITLDTNSVTNTDERSGYALGTKTE